MNGLLSHELSGFSSKNTKFLAPVKMEDRLSFVQSSGSMRKEQSAVLWLLFHVQHLHKM